MALNPNASNTADLTGSLQFSDKQGNPDALKKTTGAEEDVTDHTGQTAEDKKKSEPLSGQFNQMFNQVFDGIDPKYQGFLKQMFPQAEMFGMVVDIIQDLQEKGVMGKSNGDNGNEIADGTTVAYRGPDNRVNGPSVQQDYLPS